MATVSMLAGQRFSVASSSPAAAYAGWLLAGLGASIDHATTLDGNGLGAFLAAGATRLAAPALPESPGPVLITDVPVTLVNREQIAGLASRTRIVWVTPWGLDEGWATRPASNLTLHAAGGWMSAVGDPGREPVGPPGSLGRFVAGLFAAFEALMACWGSAGPGLSVVSIAESVAATLIYDPVAFQYSGRLRPRTGNRFSATQAAIATFPCSDGYAGLHASLHAQWVTFCGLIGHPELPADPRFAAPGERMQHLRELDAYILPWYAARSRFEAYHELQRARVPASPLPTIREILDSPQLAARDAWQEIRTPDGCGMQLPRGAIRVQAENPPTVATTRTGPGPWSPARLRVVDLSMGWAGPLVSQVLACYGADVIKIESHRRFDWWRSSRPPGDDPALALHERSHLFNSVNRGKRDVTLDLTTPAGRALAIKLVAGADVVVENFAAGVLEKLGLGYAVLSAENPRLVMLRLPGFGSTGPEAHYLAFGNTIEGGAGLTALTGYEGGPPQMMSNAIGDPVGGLTGALGVVAALVARGRDGRGRCIEAAQLECFLPLVSEALIDVQKTGEQPPRRGNRVAGSAFSGVFQCSGDDRWVAIDASTAEQRDSLAAIARGARSGGSTAAFEKTISDWAATHTPEEAARVLGEAGIAAAPVNNEADLLAFEPLAGSKFFQGEVRQHVGFHLYPGLPILRDGSRHLPPGPAPLLGEHSAAILGALGVGDAEFAALHDAGVTGEEPDLGPRGTPAPRSAPGA